MTNNEINALIIGEIGTGKSTLINYLTNLFHDGSLRNLKVAIPTRYLSSNIFDVDERMNENLSESQTERCRIYRYHVKHVTFQFFDTPGLSTDVMKIDEIVEFLRPIDTLSAIIFVVNGSQPRLTINVRSVLEQFRSRIPSLFSSNIILLLTHCHRHTVNFDWTNLLPNVPIFHMQNSAFTTDPQTWTEQTLSSLRFDWNSSMETLNQLIKTILLFSPQSTKLFSKINDDRNQLRSIFHQCRLMIIQLQSIDYEQPKRRTKTIEVNELHITEDYNTLCLQCNAVCHENCSLMEATEIGENLLRQCQVMDSGRCTVCPGRCSYRFHYQDRLEIRPVQRIIQCVDISSNDLTPVDEKFCEQLKKIRRILSNSRTSKMFNEVFNFIKLLENDMKPFRSTALIERIEKFIDELKRMTKKRKSTHRPNHEEMTTEQLLDRMSKLLESFKFIGEEIQNRCPRIRFDHFSNSDLLHVCDFYKFYEDFSVDELRRAEKEFHCSNDSLREMAVRLRLLDIESN